MHVLQPQDVEYLDNETAGELCTRILRRTDLDGWQIGKTRVFLRAGQLAQIEVPPPPPL